MAPGQQLSGAAPRAVGADSHESEPRRQGGMYGTLVERASTLGERAHRWIEDLEGDARRSRAATASERTAMGRATTTRPMTERQERGQYLTTGG